MKAREFRHGLACWLCHSLRNDNRRWNHFCRPNLLKCLQNILHALWTSHFIPLNRLLRLRHRLRGTRHLLEGLRLIKGLLLLLLLPKGLLRLLLWHAHRRSHKVTKARSRLLSCRRRKLFRKLRIIAENVIRIHSTHLRTEEGIAHMKHKSTSHQ